MNPGGALTVQRKLLTSLEFGGLRFEPEQPWGNASVAFAHAFEQGKRTAFEAMWHFLRLNGYDLAIEDSALWEVPVIDLIERRSTEEEFALALRPFVVER